jgi:F-type H+-transporting ATPase subunit b
MRPISRYAFSTGSPACASFARWGRVLQVAAFCVLALAIASAQENRGEPKPAAPAAKPAAGAHQKPPSHEQKQPGINQEFGEPLAAESAKAAGEHAGAEAENSQEEMVDELKHSPSVRWMAKHLHISPVAAYWVGYLIDFGLLTLVLVFALRKNLPAMFRTRTKTIQRGIEEAGKASEEANRRLSGIEARLAKLDAEVAAMRTSAEQDAAVEEQRILAAAEEDKRRIVETAEAEITASVRLARRELKAYVADLAVTLAERRIHIDAATDQALVRSFVGELGADQSGDGAGKDGN